MTNLSHDLSEIAESLLIDYMNFTLSDDQTIFAKILQKILL